MLQETWTVEKIELWLQRVSSGEERFQEGKAWELLELLEESDDANKRVVPNKSVLLSMLAKARFERVGKVDHLVDRWLNEALNSDPANALAHQLKVNEFLHFLKAIPIPDKFPPIRETDHGSAKKITASEYEQIAERFFVYVETYENLWKDVKSSLPYVEDVDQVQMIDTISYLIVRFQDPFKTILKATKEYADSLTGVYYSASQFQEITKSTKQIEQLMNEWNDELFSSKVTQNDVTALDELQNMVGLEGVKERVEKLYQFLHYQQERVKQGFHTKDGINLHMILQGNPGTGKTHLARLIAKIYFELGLLERDEVYEIDRSQLVGAFVGQTEENTLKAIERAKGGVLFIDEAYTLRRAGAAGNDYGQTVVDTLVSAMTSGQYAGTFSVILAGYPEEMRTFLRANPGLRSRFPEQNQIEIDDYSVDELLEIGELVAIENDYLLTSEAKKEFVKRIENAKVDESFGNARAAKSIILDAIFQKGAHMSLENPQADDFVLLEAEDFKETNHHIEEKTARSELENLIGLEQVKKQVTQFTSFVRIQQLRRETGLQTLPLQVHSVFTGNPGTGKTTVAKLYAKSLREIGLLKRGHLIVVSRADLVAGYVGQTAQKTKEKVKDSLGGVLFIDEAYSLLSAGPGDFGKEVINTLVQEMTEHEENLVVILAGYTKEMNALLESNPGLHSRFKKHIQFDDYSKQELIEIIERRAEQTGYRFTSEAKEVLSQMVSESGHKANGRYAVDLFEELIQIQAFRLVEYEKLEPKQLATIEKEDVQLLVSTKRQ
ncbi:AAA family ATPase [Alkalihalobacillus deserti]|uniref:AAA family ATPase n=1 Tax=Alkalihalobacillus deserti TaxID=2879466 RepID=UPI001D154FAA|nr:AAA family ATPase [Alkalihalobacillus deserti]